MNNMNRENTYVEALTPTVEGGIRSLSMGSIALMSRIGNKTCEALVKGEDIDLENREDILEFVWSHVADKDEVIKSCLIFQQNPYILKNKVYQWSLEVGDKELSDYITQIIFDQKHIMNAESEVVPEPGQKKSLS